MPDQKRFFASEKSMFVGVIVAGVTTLLPIGLVYNWETNVNMVFRLLVTALPIALLLWVWFDTGYIISGSELYCRAGPFRSKIHISTIRELTANTTQWSGYKLALATKGLLIKYNRWDELYISPVRQSEFVKALLQLNPAIEIKL